MSTLPNFSPSPAATPRLPVPLWAARLGYAGLLPFVGLALCALLVAAELRIQAAWMLLAYGASIVSFLGAIHWGLAMRSAEPSPWMPERPWLPWVWGVVPSLVAWFSLVLPLAQGLIVLALQLAVCLAVDWRSYPAYGLCAWLRMRLRLSLVAMGCLLVGAMRL